ncbi:MAG: hydrogenase expression/formation protein HypE [Spirochaetes bacterium]|nr:hydrogenase expression/formation protein HypE [Spirochaetota bacterium]
MEIIVPAHGSGGKPMNDLITNLIKSILGNETIQLDDAACLTLPGSNIAFTTDSYTITPIEFSGGSIGSLAINGTVNDLAVMGATPLYISCALILEEGLEIETLRRILISMKEAAVKAGVAIVTGDTKVVPKGKGDGIYINTAGIGVFINPPQRREIKPGDSIIINGTIGDHGTTIMALRNNLTFSKGLSSDCAALNHLILDAIKHYPDAIKFMRDATRGGVASILNEITKNALFGATLFEDSLPVKDEVRGVAEILGIDPLYIANEGKVVMIVDSQYADGIVAVMKNHPEGKEAAIIGTITSEFPGKAFMQTKIGGKRILPVLIEEQLPRIC